MKKPQNYDNHIRYYTPHHFVFYPLGIALAAFCAYEAYQHPAGRDLWLALAGITVLVLYLSFMLRQHYALMNQNRIVRLELRFRYYVLTQQRFEPIEQQLSQGQLFALRFASDEELPALVQRTLKEHLPPDEIKKSIRHWLPDYMRV